MTEAEADRVLADYDIDGDRKVSQKEYLSHATFSKSR
jgi:hypothetical protein